MGFFATTAYARRCVTPKTVRRERQLSVTGSRFYSAGLGRWTSRDPEGEAGGANLLEACGNSTPNLVDPFGLKVLWRLDDNPIEPSNWDFWLTQRGLDPRPSPDGIEIGGVFYVSIDLTAAFWVPCAKAYEDYFKEEKNYQYYGRMKRDAELDYEDYPKKSLDGPKRGREHADEMLGILRRGLLRDLMWVLRVCGGG
jgi:RHS repeat-associated protein